jgi:hypothetical protein
MIRMPTRWSGKIWMWAVVYLLVIAMSDDFWSVAVAGPHSQLIVVADDDDLGGSAGHIPAFASGSFGCTNLRWFVRGATEITGPAELSSGFASRHGPRGPPADGSEATRPPILFLARRHRFIDGRPAPHRSDNASSKLPITYSATIVTIVGVV